MREILRKNDWVMRFILNLLAQHPYGLSSWEIKNIIKIPIETVKYNLKKLMDLGYIEKVGRKFILPYKYKIVNGIIILKTLNSVTIFSCPYFKNVCKCEKKDKKRCKYFKELPDAMIRIFKEL